ncbi:MAG: hypothetical protein IPI95_15620 [Flavobacteriales bacterium]|nr:hypothetical protein [Flavobacteriales bacterium]
MAIVLGTDDPVFSNGKQTTAPKPIPAPAPAPAPAAVYDYQQYTDPYTAIPDSQGYASPVPGVVDSTPYWVNDPGYVGSGGGYTLDPKTGLVWIDPLNRWGTLTELQNAFYGAGTGAYGESVSPAGYVPPPEPSAVQKAADSAFQFVAAPYDYTLPGYTAPQSAPVEIKNQQVGYANPWDTVPGAAGYYQPGSGLDQVDMTPSSRAVPNITSGGNVWDSTLQTWVDPSGRIWWPALQDWLTRAEYLRVTKGLSRYESPLLGVVNKAAGMFPFVDNAAPEAFNALDRGGPALSPDFARADADLVSTIAGQPYAYQSSSGLPIDYVDDALQGVERRDFSYVDPYKYEAAAKLFNIANRTLGRAYPLKPLEEEFASLPTLGENDDPASVLPAGQSTMFYKEERDPVTGEKQTILWRWDGSKAERAQYSIAPETQDLVPQSWLHRTADAISRIVAPSDPGYAAAKLLGKDEEAEQRRKSVEDVTFRALQNNNNIVGALLMIPGGLAGNIASEVAYAAVDVLLEENTDMPPWLRTLLSVGAAIGAGVTGDAAAAKRLGGSGDDLLRALPDMHDLDSTNAFRWDIPSPDVTAGRISSGGEVISGGKRMVVNSGDVVAREVSIVPDDVSAFLSKVDSGRVTTTEARLKEVSKETLEISDKYGIETDGRAIDDILNDIRNIKEVKQELYNPATGKVVTVTSDNLADAEDNLVEAFRPSSLKRGDEVLLSRGTDGPDFASTTKYKVADDTPFVEPGSSVRITDLNTGKSFNVEAGTIWRVSDANVDEGTILLNSGITLDNIAEMATSVWGGVTRVFLRNVPTEEGIRPGVLLHPKTAGIIGEDVLRGKNGGKQIIETAKYLDQVEIPNVAGTLSSQLRVQVKKLGRLRKTKDGAELALDIKPSKRDLELGLQHPFLTDVVEHYGDYDLTPEQLQAILNMNQLNDLKVQEQLLRGIKLDQIETELGKRGYMPHAVSRIGKVKMKETDLSTGRKLRIQLDRERQWETLAEGFTKGDVGYASFFEAFDEHSLRSLKRAGRAHIESLARIAGIDPAELANPVLKENQRKMTEKVLRLGKRVKQAEIRAGMYERFEQDMLKVYDDVVHAMPDEPVASLRKLPGVIKAEFEKAEQLDGLIRNTALPDEDRIKHASEWVAQTKKNVTMLKNEIGSIMDEVKNSVARDAVAQDHLHAVNNRLKDLLKRADEIQAKAEPMEISRDILRKVKLVRGADRKAINADIRNLNNQIKKVRSEKLGIAVAAKQGVAAETEVARAARGVANSKAAAQSALRSISESADQRAGAQLRRAMERVDHLVPQGIERVAHLDNVTTHLESRIERLRGLGGKWKEVADQLYKDIDDAEQAKEFFKEAYAKSLSGANTKLTISGLRKPTRGNIDPLKNLYFQEKTAKMLEDYFADPAKRGWHWLPAYTVNIATIPFQVTLDGSIRIATMGRLLYALAVVDPKAAAKAATAEYVNAAVTVINKIARTSIESPAYFDSWRSQAEVAHAAHFVRMRTGLNSQPDEFFFLRAGKRIPGLGKAMEVSELDFSRTGDRFMVGLFLARERALAKAGIHVDDAMRQKIGREISQLGGIPWNMASTDLERQLVFAANFFRSHLELHWSAMTKWGADNIDGHMARQDLATVYGMATMIATVAAVKQGRDPVEVLSPFDLDAMRDGEIRWNPNFLTARINGFDQSLVGPWGTMLKLFATMGIGVYDTVRSGGDPKPLISALYYAASSKGSPALKLVVDLMVGHDFNGRRFNPIGDPLSTARSIGARWLPITFQNILADTESNMPWDMVLTSAITNYLGGTSAPVSAWELRDNYIRNMDIFSSRPELLLDKNRPPSWRNLTSLGKRLVTAEYGTVEVTSWDSIVRANRRAQIDREYGTAMQTLDKEFDKGNLRVDSWLEERAIQRALKEERLLNLYGNNTDYDERDPVQKYYKGFDLFIKDKIPPDWDGFEEWQVRNMSKGERDQVEEFFKTSSSTYTPVEARYQKASKAMQDAGYYDVRDEKFKEFAESNGIDPKMTRTEWQRSIVEAQVKEYMSGQTFANDEDRARKQDAYREWAWEHLNDNELVTAWNDYWYDEFVRDFIIDNPEAAIDADTFHKLSIRKAELELLQANATEDEMRASIQALNRFEEINDIPKTWEEKAWTTFEFPSDSGVEKKATRKETADAYKEQQAISTFSKSYGELTAAQKKAVDAKWDDLQDPWYKVDRSTRILNFLDVWDSLETDAERKEFLDVALSPKEGNNFNFLSNVRDLRVLLVANEQRKQLGLPTFDIIFEGAPISTKEAMWIVYREMGLSEADLAPR